MIRAFIFLALVSTPAFAGSLKQGVRANTGPRDEPISRAVPNLPGGNVAVDAPPGPFFQDFKPPFPTTSWWSGYTVTNQDAIVAGPFPFQSATTSNGLVFGMADTRRFDGTSIHVDTQRDLTVGIAGLPNDLTHRKATAWDTQTVSLQYFNGNGATMDTTLAPGSPYMTFTFNNAAIVITSEQGDILSFNWVQQGVKGKLTTAGGTYIIYVIGSPVTLNQETTKTLVSPPGFSGTLRFAKLKEASQESVLDTHSGTYPTGLTMSYNVAGDVGSQTWTWDVVGNPDDLLVLSWSHHRKTLQGANFVNLEYLTLKGPMKAVRGNTWRLQNTLPTISWFAKNPPQASCVPELIKTLEAEIEAIEPANPGDFYFWGGSFAAHARLALIAEHVGRMDLIDKVLSVTKESMNHWFDPAHRPAAAYEPGWGGFINGDGWNNTWVDFGNAYYNDHHFHYGYILTGAAVIGKYDPAWLNEHKEFFIHIARDIGNPSPNDPHYTVTRCLDFFAGHSWASGIANGAGGRDQESSGEAINGYYGLLLFATAINDQVLIDYARLVLAIEIAGAQEYWHLYPKRGADETPYPEQAFRELVTVGNVMDVQAGAWLFWGAERTQIAAIQILPLTPIGEYTFDADWMREVLPYCQQELDDPQIGDAFKSVIWAAYAKVNPQQAYQASENLFDWGTGNTASNQLYFVATQTAQGDICSAGTQTPEGTFYIQDVATGKYVTVSGAGQLAATAGADVLGAKMTLKFTPGGSTIKGPNGKFVTASPDGTQPLAASRDTAEAYETFRWTVQGDGSYELTAMVNKAKVNTGAAGGLVNAGAASKYRLTAATGGGAPNIPANGVLKSVQSNQYVIATAANPTLYANVAAGQATRFAFEKIAGSPADAPLYDIRSLTTNMVVTGDVSGTVPLAALRAEPQAWENFQIIPYQNAYILIHAASGMAAALQGDNTLIDNDNSIGNNALWTIE